jgi:hypothetical protein
MCHLTWALQVEDNDFPEEIYLTFLKLYETFASVPEILFKLLDGLTSLRIILEFTYIRHLNTYLKQLTQSLKLIAE